MGVNCISGTRRHGDAVSSRRVARIRNPPVLADEALGRHTVAEDRHNPRRDARAATAQYAVAAAAGTRRPGHPIRHGLQSTDVDNELPGLLQGDPRVGHLPLTSYATTFRGEELLLAVANVIVLIVDNAYDSVATE